MKKYSIQRIEEKTLKRYLKNAGAVLITGPKFCGKTCLAESISNSEFYFNNQKIKSLLDYNDENILDGETPRLIDEWQYYPEIWDFIRNKLDRNETDKKIGQYIITGSTSPFGKCEILHSGAGRILRMKMFTLSFAEIFNLDSDKSISLLDLFNGHELPTLKNHIDNDTINHYMFIGGWPQIIAQNLEEPKLIIEGYVESVLNMDTKKYYDLRINKTVLRKITTSIARNISSQLTETTIMEDIGNSIDRRTLSKYVQMLSEIDLFYSIPAWGKDTNLRSATKQKTKPKIYMCDTSIASSLLDIKSPAKYYSDLHTTGLIFENQVMKDLMVYCQAIDGKLYFYRDTSNREIDAIIELDDGRWAAIEIKLSLNAAMEAADKLDSVVNYLTKNNNKTEPSFRMIITNCDATYKTKSGIYIVPHVLLRP